MSTTRQYTGELHFDDCDQRWEIYTPDGFAHSLHCGDVVELKIGGHWIRTSVEASGGVFHATQPGVRLCTGLKARLPQ